MHRRMSKRKKVGLPPGTLVYIGKHEDNENFKIHSYSFNENEYEEATYEKADDALKSIQPNRFTWLNVTGLNATEEVEKLGKFASIHNLFLEDILDTEHRPKIEELNDSLLVIIKMIHLHDKQISIEHLAFILGENYLISFQESDTEVFHSVKKRLKESSSIIRRKGADYLLFNLMDVIVDQYFLILEDLTEKIEDFEDQIIAQPKDEMIGDIQDLKREAMSIRRSVYPLRDVISKLEKTQNPIVRPDTLQYFKDLYEHTIHVGENLDTYRDMILGLMDMYMSSVGNRMNSIMKVLTIMSTIFIPMTFIAGVYGMNFNDMPFLKNPYGYHITWAVMIGIAIVMLIFYKRKKWL